MTTSREIRLASRPTGEATLDDFETAEVKVPQPGPGQVLVRNTWMSVDPYMRGRMDDVESYIPPFQLGAPLDGSAVGEVVASGDAAIPVGATVTHFLGWREYALLNAAEATVLDVQAARPQDYLGALGTTGLTAYLAVTRIAPVKKNDTVFISGAAGAVGSIAGQLARKFGAAKVIGSAGGPEKGKRLIEDFGFDAAIDYRNESLPERLAELAPDGIDVYVDNVGGDHLEAAIDALKVHGGVALVGMISGYDDRPKGPRNIYSVVTKRLTLRGVLVTDHLDVFPEYIGKAAGWLADGTLHAQETVLEGLENAPEAFLGVMRGANTGKMLVRL